MIYSIFVVHNMKILNNRVSKIPQRIHSINTYT